MSELIKIMAQMKKDYGDQVGSVGAVVTDIKRVKTDLFPFDLATGGGWLRSRMNCVYGPESSGKTNLALRAIRHVQRHCWVCDQVLDQCTCNEGPTKKVGVFIDVEHSYDTTWGQRLGIDNSELVLMHPTYGEQVVDMVEAFLQAEEVGIIVLDSIAALAKHNMLTSSAEKMDVGGSSLLVSSLTRKVVSAMSIERKRGHEPCLLCINQTRTKIGQMFGDPETMPGGASFRFNNSLIVRVYGKNLEDKEVSIHLPAYKDTTAVVKKFKCPIVHTNFEYKLCLLPQEEKNLGVGDSPAWNTVSTYLKNYNLLGKADKGGGWLCIGPDGDLVSYPTLKSIQEAYFSNPGLRIFLEGLIMDRERNAANMIGAPSGE